MNKENIQLYSGEKIKPIKNYEGLYSITSYGRVWSHEKIRRFGKNYRIYRSRFLKFSIDKGGYELVSLRNLEKRKTFKIHRLVAQHFILNLNDLPEVNHKDCNKQNNHTDNLEWSTTQHNHNHALVNGLKKYKKSSKYYGVSHSPGLHRKKAWMIRTTINNKRKTIGLAYTEIEAAIIYNNFVIKHNLDRPLNNIHIINNH